MPNKISVLLVDDHSLVRRGFRRILEDAPDIFKIVLTCQHRGSIPTNLWSSSYFLFGS